MFFKVQKFIWGGQKIIFRGQKCKKLGSSVWATYRILNDEQTLTLDDMTLNDISRKLGVDFKISNDSIYQIIKEISNEI